VAVDLAAIGVNDFTAMPAGKLNGQPGFADGGRPIIAINLSIF